MVSLWRVRYSQQEHARNAAITTNGLRTTGYRDRRMAVELFAHSLRVREAVDREDAVAMAKAGRRWRR